MFEYRYHSAVSLSLMLLATALLTVFLSFNSPAHAAKEGSETPPYQRSGPIPGTKLTYSNFHVASSGKVTVTIVNPENSGVNFTATFSFFSAKNEYLTGFVIEGFAQRSSKTSYSVTLREPKKIKKASFMKVLGRSGRTSARTIYSH